MTFAFAEGTRRMLAEAGWTPERVVDERPFVAALHAWEYDACDDMPARLGSLLGLAVAFRHPVHDDIERFELDPGLGAAAEGPERMEEWAEQAGEPLCPIGQAYRGNMTLVMGPSGRVYAGRDSLLKVVGDTLEEAVDTLCAARPFRPLGDVQG